MVINKIKDKTNDTNILPQYKMIVLVAVIQIDLRQKLIRKEHVWLLEFYVETH